MKIVNPAALTGKDGFTDLCEAFALFWDKDGFTDLCQAFQLYWQEDEHDPSQSSLRKIMSMVVLEDVKAHFLKVKAKVETARRQGVDLTKEDFSIDIQGNPGTGKNTVRECYNMFLISLGLARQTTSVSDNNGLLTFLSPRRHSHITKHIRPTMRLPDYSNEEFLQILARKINQRFSKKLKIEGGVVGLYSRIFVRRIGRGRAKKDFENVRALERALSKVYSRQADRLDRERRDGKSSNDFLLTKGDIFGPKPSDVQSSSAAWEELQSMVGLESVKETIQELFGRIGVNYEREIREQEPIYTPLNRVFLGPPGTGKTTVARLYGQVLADIGLLSNGEVVTKNPSDFIAAYLGQSEDRTRKILAASAGKVLLIDDTQMLYPESRSGSWHDTDICRTAVIDTLVAEVQNVAGEDRCIILMGHPDQMEELFQNSNPGLTRRFSLEDSFHFSDFDDFQLGRVLDLKLSRQGLRATSEVRDVALQLLSRARDRPNLRNGGEVENLLSRTKAAHLKKISRLTRSQEIGEVALEAANFDPEFDRAFRASSNSNSLFKDMVGCQDIIEQFHGYQQMAAGMQLRGIDPLPYVPSTFVFKGLPGTGKTTIVRKVGLLFYDMAFISSSEVIECSVSNLVARRTGQTGPKVNSILESALGKVLFIDEAYRLGEGDFANEAVGELVDGMTKTQFKNKIVIVLAGYEEDMNRLMVINQGLRSRFPTEVVFRSMRPDQCLFLLQRRIDEVGIQLDGLDKAESAGRARVMEVLAKLTAMQSWANGRVVERLAGRVIAHVFKADAATNNGKMPLAICVDELGTLLNTTLEKAGTDEAETVVSITRRRNEAWKDDSARLAEKLRRRYERTGNVDDLEAATRSAEMAVSAISKSNPNRPTILVSLASCLGRRFERTGSMTDLNGAVDVAEKALNATPEDHPNRAGRLNNLGNWLARRFDRTGSIGDLNRAIDVADKAVDATPEDHPNRAMYLNNLGASLGRRFERTGSMTDLNGAVNVAEKAVNATPEDHPNRAGRLGNLGNKLGSRFDRTRVPGHLEQSISAFKKGWECRSAPPSVRIRLARKVAAHLASKSQWKKSSTLLDSAVQLLPLVSLRSLQHTDKQHLLAQFAGLASMTASIAINADKTPYDALRFLELGRGVIAGLLLDMRTDLSELQQQHPALADKFTFLRDELDSPADTASFSTAFGSEHSVENKVKRRLDAEKRFEEVLDEIRSTEGFANFLCPATEDELKTAASSGPVVFVNVSSYRCDALLVRQHHPISVLELPELRLHDIESHNKSFRTADSGGMHQTLGWLWDVVASPVLDALGFNQPPSDGDWPQIWWIPTGQLSQLPLHAAGRHFKPSTDTVLDRAMSSYSASIKALLYGRRYRRNLDHPTSESAVLVTVPGSGLRFAGREVAMLEGLCPSLKLHPVKPAPKRAEILAQLRSCRIFHFASHGKSNPLEPSESCLVLGKEKSITVADLRDCRLQERSPFLAYLSACSTKVNEAGRLVDEDIHLVSACQLAGFRHVVGTLWEVSDEHCVDVAKTLYETIKDEGMTDVAVCRGLHKAIRALRDKDVATAPIEEGCTMQVAVVQDKTRDRKGPVQQEHANQSESDDMVRHSDWSITGRCSQLDGPRIWAAYIHVGL